MRFAPNCFLNECVSTDSSRPNLTAVYYDKAKHRLCACNGATLATIPVTNDDDDVQGYVSAATMKAAAKDGVVFLTRTHEACSVGSAVERPKIAELFPPIDQVIPQYKHGDEGTVTFGFDVAYLLGVVKAIGARCTDDDKPGVTRRVVYMTLPLPRDAKDSFDPIRVEEGVEGAVGVIMPCRR